MKNLLLLIFASLLFIFPSCQKQEKCADVQHVNERVYMMEKYFQGYQPGAVWIYLNRDSSKRDSIYLDNFSTTNAGQNKNCLTGDITAFDMYSNYLANNQKMNVKIGFDKNGDAITNIFEAKDAQGNIYTRFYAKNEDFTGFYSNTSTYSIAQNYPLWPNDPTYILPEYVRIDNLVFAPDFGLVQYVPVGTTDTFSLIKFYFL